MGTYDVLVCMCMYDKCVCDIRVCVFTSIRVCVSMYMYTCVRTCIYVYPYIGMYVDMYVYVDTRAHTYSRTCIRMKIGVCRVRTCQPVVDPNLTLGVFVGPLGVMWGWRCMVGVCDPG